jgi:hypothetical protein
VAQLVLALEGDDDEAVRQTAASGLGELADKRGVGALRRCLQLEQSQVVKRSCRVSLARLDPTAATMGPEPTGAASAAGVVGPAPASSARTFSRSSPTAEPGDQDPLLDLLKRHVLSLGVVGTFAVRWREHETGQVSE